MGSGGVLSLYPCLFPCVGPLTWTASQSALLLTAVSPACRSLSTNGAVQCALVTTRCQYSAGCYSSNMSMFEWAQWQIPDSSYKILNFFYKAEHGVMMSLSYWARSVKPPRFISLISSSLILSTNFPSLTVTKGQSRACSSLAFSEALRVCVCFRTDEQ